MINKIGKLKYWVIDVDGTMTDSGIYYDELGNELKKFCTRDAAGFFAARNVGMKVIVLTGRECKATERRMTELKVDYLFQNVKDKHKFLTDFMRDNNILKSEMAYIGDDLNDLYPMQLTEFVGCPYDGCKEVTDIADYISSYKGGSGAVRDVIEYVLRKRGQWESAIKDVYGFGA